MMTSRGQKTSRVTVFLPTDLADAAERYVSEGKAMSRNDLIVMAIRRMIDQLNRETIDTAFAAAAFDEDYQREDCLLTQELDPASDEASRLIEG